MRHGRDARATWARRTVNELLASLPGHPPLLMQISPPVLQSSAFTHSPKALAAQRLRTPLTARSRQRYPARPWVDVERPKSSLGRGSYGSDGSHCSFDRGRAELLPRVGPGAAGVSAGSGRRGGCSTARAPWFAE